MLTQVRRIPVRPPVLITIHALALLFALALYGFEVFGNHKPPTSGVLWRFLLVFVALCASLYRIIKNLKTSRKMIETHYADKIGHAFDEDPVKKKRLLSALLAYNRDDWGACLKKAARPHPAGYQQGRKAGHKILYRRVPTGYGSHTGGATGL